MPALDKARQIVYNNITDKLQLCFAEMRITAPDSPAAAEIRADWSV